MCMWGAPTPINVSHPLIILYIIEFFYFSWLLRVVSSLHSCEAELSTLVRYTCKIFSIWGRNVGVIRREKKKRRPLWEKVLNCWMEEELGHRRFTWQDVKRLPTNSEVKIKQSSIFHSKLFSQGGWVSEREDIERENKQVFLRLSQ